MSIRPIIVVTAQVVLLAVASTTAVEVQARQFALPQVVAGQSEEVCQAAAKIISTTTKAAFRGGQWRDRFGSIKWKEHFDPTMLKDGHPAAPPYKYTTVDIYNDGQTDVVVVYTTLFSSVDWDWLYLFTPIEFQAAKESGTVDKSIRQVPELNPGNLVQFANGQSGVPVELHLWRYKGTYFILLKENFFAQNEPHTPNSFFVAKLGRSSAKRDDTYKVHRLLPELVCRIVAT